jgi:nitrate reductase NapE
VSAGAEAREKVNLATGPSAPRKRLETLAFLVLAVFIWPIIAVGIVAGWGFLVWMYYLYTGPPGPV